MADSSGWQPSSSTLPDSYCDSGRNDEHGSSGGGSRAVAEVRVLETRRSYPRLPAERTPVFMG